MQLAQANAQTKNCKRASTFATRRKNYFLKSLPSKIFKTANTQTNKTENGTNKMTAKGQKYSDLTMTVDRRPAYNITYTQAGGSCFVGQESGIFEVQFFVGSSVVKCPACV